ncbi:MAG TPA: cytochrome c3 family protein [Pyrinomonadaceae bacterium]|nr:cytochrome c3 family protein [Pyrinomonadaceae bacterium]
MHRLIIRSQRGRATVSTAVVLGLLLLPLFWASTAGAIEPAPRRRPTQQRRAPAQRAPRIDYKNFSHRTHVEQQKLACDSCHTFPTKNWNEVRKGDEAFPDVVEFPEHASCLNCHRTQFFARERPAPAICSNCHVAVTPKNTARFPFPSLGEPFFASARAQSFAPEFDVYFPHETHADVVSFYRPAPGDLHLVRASFASASAGPQQTSNCAVCHETYQAQGTSDVEFVTPPPKSHPEDAFWLKKGTFKTTPRTHTLCFTCHSTDGGLEPLPTNCGGCHKLRGSEPQMQRDYTPQIAAKMGVKDAFTLLKWSRRSAGRFRHEFDVHKELGCETCHQTNAMNTLDERTFVSVKSCGGEGSGCHVESNTDGILNAEIDQKQKNPAFQCTKCHIILGKQPIPRDHLDALPKPASK